MLSLNEFKSLKQNSNLKTWETETKYETFVDLSLIEEVHENDIFSDQSLIDDILDISLLSISGKQSNELSEIVMPISRVTIGLECI